MFIFRIIGLLLTASPLSFTTEYIMFPYSFLGLVLYTIATLFENKYPILIGLSLFISTATSSSIISHKMLSYMLFLWIFLIVHLFYIGSEAKSKISQIITVLLLLVVLGSIFEIQWIFIGFVLLSVILMIEGLSRKFLEKNHTLYEKTENITDIDAVIPSDEQKYDNTETYEYVIPTDNE